VGDLVLDFSGAANLADVNIVALLASFEATNLDTCDITLNAANASDIVYITSASADNIDTKCTDFDLTLNYDSSDCALVESAADIDACYVGSFALSTTEITCAATT